MKRFLVQLENRMETMSPQERADIAVAYQSLIRAVTSSTQIIGGHFRPSTMAAIELIGSLTSAMTTGGAEKFLAKLRDDAPKVGPHVAALVRAL